MPSKKKVTKKRPAKTAPVKKANPPYIVPKPDGGGFVDLRCVQAMTKINTYVPQQIGEEVKNILVHRLVFTLKYGLVINWDFTDEKQRDSVLDYCFGVICGL